MVKSMKIYIQIGEKRIIDGKEYYSPDYYDDGLTFGYIYKNEKAFYENPKEICYIPEAFFDERCDKELDDREWWHTGGYTRKDLEDMLYDEDGNPIYLDGDDEEVDAKAFFRTLLWACPETYINELTYNNKTMTQFTTKEQMLDVLHYLYPNESNLEYSIRDWSHDSNRKEIVINPGHSFSKIQNAITEAGIDTNHVFVSCDSNIRLCIDNFSDK